MKLSEELRIQLFESRDYRQFIKKVISDMGAIKGYKSQLANHMGCQAAYFSQVMAGKAELTPEQAERLTAFWELTGHENDFFFNLVLLGRAGTVSLRKRLEKKLEDIHRSWKVESSTYGKKPVQESSKSMLYYSHWLHSAVHLLLTIPTLQKEKKLAEHLGRSEQEISKIIQELHQAELVERTSTGWRARQIQIHASEENFFAEVHHKNWRSQALEVKKSQFQDVIRYTSVHSLSKDDFKKIQSMIEEMIRNSRRTIENSPEEMAACLLIDYFAF